MKCWSLKMDERLFLNRYYCFRIAEVLGAIMSIFGIWLLTAFLCYFSIDRLVHTDFDIDAHTMMLISAIGIGINVM